MYEDNGGFGRDENPYEGSMFSAPWDMFQHLDGIFRSFGLAELPPFLHGPDMPALEGPSEQPGHLRDHMLKVPDYQEPFRRSPDMVRGMFSFCCCVQQTFLESGRFQSKL